MAKLAGQLPKGDANGLSRIDRSLVEHPHHTHAAIVIVDCKKVTTDTDSNEVEATARIRRIEVIRAEDLPTAEQLMRRSLEARMGRSTLPIEIEDEIAAAFGAVDVTALKLDDTPDPAEDTEDGDDQ